MKYVLFYESAEDVLVKEWMDVSQRTGPPAS